ncbi:MAG: flotillin-like protein FloA [Kiritimatiellae bacterium]|nr:flotillin-like protein FloA [Kiritimatiellia bacterium]MDD5521210.1 flotillin-like protein FloA [Kiritimatiellia bacterium]
MNIVQIITGIGVILVIAFVIVIFMFLRVWVKALAAGAKVSIFSLIGMKLRNVPPSLIVDARISIIKAGLDLSTDMLEAHYLAGGDVINVARSLIAADKANIDLNFQRATAIDLAGRDVLDAVRTSVIPKVIDCPDPKKGGPAMLDAVAKDGIRMVVKARVTVRTNLERLVGGAGEDTIIARVGQGIVSAIGSSATYKEVLEHPDKISRKVLESGLDSQTAFEIVSIDIADLSVAGTTSGDIANVGAMLETERAEADKKLRQAEAEGRRAMAVAQEQEMRARVQEMQAKVVEAQAEVPRAMAQAFREGNLGVMDFYRMQNIDADSSMRKAIAGDERDNKPKRSE